MNRDQKYRALPDESEERLIEQLSEKPLLPHSEAFQGRVMRDIRARKPNTHRRALLRNGWWQRLLRSLRGSRRLMVLSLVLAAACLGLGVMLFLPQADYPISVQSVQRDASVAGVTTRVFRLRAPAAESVFLVGDFTG